MTTAGQLAQRASCACRGGAGLLDAVAEEAHDIEGGAVRGVLDGGGESGNGGEGSGRCLGCD